MDPISQGLAGSLAAGAARTPRLRWAFIAGAAGGMAPDLDVLIRSGSDPLLGIEFHRHFTHSLFFVPFGALLVSLLLWLLFRRLSESARFAALYGFCALGMLSHGLLDTCTSYGTRLLWPLSERRYAWDIISIIDPLISIPVALALLVAFTRRSRNWWRIALLWALAYLGLGVLQHQRALELQSRLIDARDHREAAGPMQRRVMPSIGNLLVWRSVYRYRDIFYIDALRPGLGTGAQHYPGGPVPAWQGIPERSSVLERDLDRFRSFSDGYLGLAPASDPAAVTVGDLRYSALPQDTQTLWGLRFSPADADRHAEFYTSFAPRRDRLAELWSMIKGNACEPPTCIRLAP